MFWPVFHVFLSGMSFAFALNSAINSAGAYSIIANLAALVLNAMFAAFFWPENNNKN